MLTIARFLDVRVHLTNMLPSFRLAATGSDDEELAAATDTFDDMAVGESLDEAAGAPFNLTDVKFVEYPSRT